MRGGDNYLRRLRRIVDSDAPVATDRFESDAVSERSDYVEIDGLATRQRLARVQAGHALIIIPALK